MKHKTFMELMDQQNINYHSTIQDIYRTDRRFRLAHWVREGTTKTNPNTHTVLQVNMYEKNTICSEDREIIAWLKTTCLLNNIRIVGGT